MMLQEIIQNIVKDNYSTSDLIRLLKDKNPFVRANAVSQLSNRMDDIVLKAIVDFIESKQNQTFTFFGSVSLSHLGLKALLESNHQKAIKTAQTKIANIKNTAEREEFLEFLRNENINLSEHEETTEPHLQAA